MKQRNYPNEKTIIPEVVVIGKAVTSTSVRQLSNITSITWLRPSVNHESNHNLLAKLPDALINPVTPGIMGEWVLILESGSPEKSFLKNTKQALVSTPAAAPALALSHTGSIGALIALRSPYGHMLSSHYSPLWAVRRSHIRALSALAQAVPYPGHVSSVLSAYCHLHWYPLIAAARAVWLPPQHEKQPHLTVAKNGPSWFARKPPLPVKTSANDTLGTHQDMLAIMSAAHRTTPYNPYPRFSPHQKQDT